MGNKILAQGVAPLYVRVSMELKEKIEVAAKEKYMSVSAYTRMVISDHIKAAEKAERR